MPILIDSELTFGYSTLCSDGSGAGGAATKDKAWLSGGNPKTACTSVDCGLPYGSQLPRPLVDWSVSDKDAFLRNTSPLDRSRECGRRAAVGSWPLALRFVF